MERVLNHPNLIVEGELNLTISTGEYWGENTRQDSLASYFHNLSEREHLVDVAPIKLEPTWRNKRGGTQEISKRLDIFLFNEDLLNQNIIIKSLVEIRGSSYHRPISLFIAPPEKNPPTPFKFNPQCLEDEQYKEQIQIAWMPLRIDPNCSVMK